MIRTSHVSLAVVLALIIMGVSSVVHACEHEHAELVDTDCYVCLSLINNDDQQLPRSSLLDTPLVIQHELVPGNDTYQFLSITLASIRAPPYPNS